MGTRYAAVGALLLAAGFTVYTPLRAVVLVTWKAGTTARLLGSVEEIQAAAGKGDVTLKRPGVVVNMPILSWPGGRR